MGRRADALTGELLRLALGNGGASDPNRARRVLYSASASTWKECLVRLYEHRLLGLAYHGLVQNGLIDRVPAEAAGTLRAQYESCRANNRMLLLTLVGLGRKFSALGVDAVACKGVVLASQYYPDPGMRTVGDVDVWIERDRFDACDRELQQTWSRRWSTDGHGDSASYVNRLGIVLDLHWRMRLFERFEGGFSALTETAPAEHGYRVFEPHALLTHLCDHFSAHQKNVGPMLCWLIDLGIVMQKQGDRLQLDRLRQLMVESDFANLMRTARMLRIFGMVLPEHIRKASESYRPFDFVTLLRRRRLTLWGLPNYIGWARLGANVLGMYRAAGRARPTVSELLLWLFDREKRW